MFAGHLGVALALGRVERRVNPAVLVSAALLPDALLWLFVLLGWESVRIPADFERHHQPAFEFPYTHGLAAAAAWSGLAGAGAFAACARAGRPAVRAALLVAAAVLSHWVLDAIVHVPEMPLLGQGSVRVGLGLWNAMPAALALESALVCAGLACLLPGSGLARARAWGLTALCLLTLAFTIAGMTVAPAPPSATAMAASSLFTIVALAAMIGWLCRPRSGVAP